MGKFKERATLLLEALLDDFGCGAEDEDVEILERLLAAVEAETVHKIAEAIRKDHAVGTYPHSMAAHIEKTFASSDET